MFNSDKKFVPVMITPFNLKAKVDHDAVSTLVEFYLAAGVKGIFANCLSSEMYSISEDERLDLTRHIVKLVNGRVPVVATGSFGLLRAALRRGKAPAATIEQQQEGGQQDTPRADGDVEPEL